MFKTVLVNASNAYCRLCDPYNRTEKSALKRGTRAVQIEMLHSGGLASSMICFKCASAVHGELNEVVGD